MSSILPSPSTTPKQQFYDTKTQDIKQAHDENMRSAAAHTDAIRKLATSIDMLTAAIARNTQIREMNEVEAQSNKNGEERSWG